jgi:hypothetical protein
VEEFINKQTFLPHEKDIPFMFRIVFINTANPCPGPAWGPVWIAVQERRTLYGWGGIALHLSRSFVVPLYNRPGEARFSFQYGRRI